MRQFFPGIAAFLSFAILASGPVIAEQTLYNAQPSASGVQAGQPSYVPEYISRSPASPVPAPTMDAQGQAPQGGGAASAEAVSFAHKAAQVCPGKWDSAECLSVISQSNFSMLSNYGALLQSQNKNDEAEQLKQHCAASTAAREQSFPAYAMKSAFIECANEISDLVDKTNLSPDLSEYQLMGAAVLCLGNDPRCAPITGQIKKLGGS